MNVAKEIARIRKEYIPSKRVLERTKYEDNARELLSDISTISFDSFAIIINLIDSDYWEDEQVIGRFYPLYSQPNMNKIETNSLERIIKFLQATYQNEDMDKVDEIVPDLKGMWYGSSSLFFYIKNPNQYSVFLPVTVKGIKKIYPKESKNLYYRRPFLKNYKLFNKLCEKLKVDYSLKPQELDIVLTIFGKKEIKEVEDEPVPLIAEKEISDHTEAEAVLLEIGNLLGFETYTADSSKFFEGRSLDEISTLRNIPDILKGTKNIALVDVIWCNEDSPPNFLFEVEDKGTMRDALLRLFQARHLNARFFIVGPKENHKKFEEWVSNAPFKSSRKLYTFRTFQDIAKLRSLIKNAEEYKKNFGII